jgi:segregation and condensation protein B
MKARKHTQSPVSLDQDLADLPAGARWREWMGRVEAAIFAARDPLPRAALAKLVGQSCKLDDLIADIVAELRARPYDLVFVAGGYQLRTKPRFSAAIRAANSGNLCDASLAGLKPTELLALMAIAYLQPATRAEISRFAGKEISRDVISRLKRQGLIDAGLRAPEPGAPFAHVTTKRFLEVFGLASLRDLPDIERLEEEGLLQNLNLRPASMAPWGLPAMTARRSTRARTLPRTYSDRSRSVSEALDAHGRR